MIIIIMIIVIIIIVIIVVIIVIIIVIIIIKRKEKIIIITFKPTNMMSNPYLSTLIHSFLYSSVNLIHHLLIYCILNL